ncbi:MAG: FAD-binding oxidoreductase [Proteobacteria bacterium]|nr:FAD-binding oxidoreductase [Pseudomonadota bacterium]MBS0574219.1 FAD-binding oxidoreductase [Pseudomonadota bacterium]
MSAALPEAFLRALERAVGAGHVGAAGGAVRVAPGSADEVAAVVRLCAGARIAMVPEGGQTGLVGGTEAGPGQVLLSLARLNHLLRLDADERVAVAEAGLPLQLLQEAAAAQGLDPGIDLAARGTATVGGMVSTNAGGVMAFRNGVMRHRVLGIEAVLPDGSVYSDLTRVVKNAAGYDLKHLFIGAEGTLGVVTKVAVRLDPLPRATASALFGLPSVAQALRLVDAALREPGVELRAAEALWPDYIRLTAGAQGWADASLPLDQPIYLALMLGGGDAADLTAAFERLFARLLAAAPEATGIIAASEAQARALWRLREDTGAIYRAFPGAPSYDISVPLSALPDHVGRMLGELAAIDPGLRPFVFGHLADGNLHVVLNRPGPLPDALAARVEAAIYRDLRGLGGSFSAEHGVGAKRVHSLMATTDPVKLRTMRLVKSALDPLGLMNPGKVLPAGPVPAPQPQTESAAR